MPVKSNVGDVFDLLKRVIDGVRAGLSWAYQGSRDATTAFFRQSAASSVAPEALAVTSKII
eukprot:15487-Eustigmatos_ZCMA.PRE.1